jgi:hypothetical protein
MIIDTMTPKEITIEIRTDFEVCRKSMERFAMDYDRERRRDKIGKEITHSKVYPIKTKNKNIWLFILSKAPTEGKYKGMESINICSLVYYYNQTGLRVFKIIPTGGLSVFNGHLFKRYNSRMILNLTNPLDIVKHFFINNGYSTAKVLPKDGRELVIGVCRDGILLGELNEGRTWLVYKTFITREDLRRDQETIEEELIDHLRDEITEEINNVAFNREEYFYKTDIFKGINR